MKHQTKLIKLNEAKLIDNTFTCVCVSAIILRITLIGNNNYVSQISFQTMTKCILNIIKCII